MHLSQSSSSKASSSILMALSITSISSHFASSCNRSISITCIFLFYLPLQQLFKCDFTTRTNESVHTPVNDFFVVVVVIVVVMTTKQYPFKILAWYFIIPIVETRGCRLKVDE